MKEKTPVIVSWSLLVSILGSLSGAAALPVNQAREAEEIMRVAGVRGGLVVHIGCGDGRLTAALGRDDGYLVHGLDRDRKDVRQAREHIHSLGRYGTVSAEQFDGAHLPYVDNLVNLVVADELGSVSMEEVLRVLAPSGVAYIRSDGRWTKTVKPRPTDIDEWSHYLHDATGNAVARDLQVGPPAAVGRGLGQHLDDSQIRVLVGQECLLCRDELPDIHEAVPEGLLYLQAPADPEGCLTKELLLVNAHG